jgi:hypothetical protein
MSRPSDARHRQTRLTATVWTMSLLVAACAVGGEPRGTPSTPAISARAAGATSGENPTLTADPSGPVATDPAPRSTLPALGMAACQDRMARLDEVQSESRRVVRVSATREVASTTADLIAASDLIVVGTLTGGVRGWSPPETASAAPTEEPGGVRVLARDFAVESVVRGDADLASTIAIRDLVELPGELPIVEYDADPLEVGADYLLFLREGRGGGIWVTSGGAQGQFRVEDGLVRMTTTCYRTAADFEGKPVDDVARMVRTRDG